MLLPAHILESVLSGLVIVDKPQGWTSHDVVAKLRRLLGTRKVGHAGTLDPMATGVLVIGVNKATRLLTYIVGTQKTYTATIRLGQTTVTDDAEGEILESRSARDCYGSAEADARVDAAIAALTGDIEQIPSSVSAIKVNGQRSYARVRAGEDFELSARPVTVSRFEVQHRNLAGPEGEFLDLQVTVECSSGTYIRALARDLGRALGVGGHLTALRRTVVGPYSVTGASSLDELASAEPADAVVPMAEAARMLLPVREVTAAQARELSFGRKIPVLPSEQASEARDEPQPTAAFAPDGSLIALLQPIGPKAGNARALMVFAEQAELKQGESGRVQGA